MDQDFDARGIENERQAPACPECGGALRTAGPGRRPVYCSRSCSSRAYRRRRVERHQDAVADALVSSRVELSVAGQAGDREILELAAAVQRSAARYLQALDEARLGQGDDPRCNGALRRLETSATAAVQRMVRQAHVLRYEMTSARLNAQREAAAVSGPDEAGASPEPTRVETNDAVPGGAPAPVPAVPAATTSVGGTGQAAPSAAPRSDTAVSADRAEISSRVEFRDIVAVPARVSISARVESSPAAVPPSPASISPRVELSGGAPASAQQPAQEHRPASVPAQQPGPVDVPVEELRLALAAERTSTFPLLRGLGAPTTTRSAEGGTFLVEGWDTAPTVFAVRRPDRSLAGWVELADNRTGWAVFIDGRAVIDAADGLAWLAETADYGVSLLKMALDQQPT
ncbi:hypothetical protein AB0D56_37900 [Streptomyces sp. NPDC048209]|uniref:hypothetical protein n=1 Tax=Streptomyces sp. NPDC048209 TaxID=3156689 RepID=UPI003412D22C